MVWVSASGNAESLAREALLLNADVAASFPALASRRRCQAAVSAAFATKYVPP